MPKLTKPEYGAPCWVDLTTREFEKSKEFYGQLFGWVFTDMGPEFGHYHIVSKDGADFGGAMEVNPEFMPADAPNMWGMFFSVEDIGATLEKMEAAGGNRMMDPMQVGNQGLNTWVQDPQGTPFGLWQPMDRVGFDIYEEPGFPAWFELHTRNFEEAVKFYTSTLGVQRGEEPMEGMNYATLNVNGGAWAGIMDATEFMQEGQPNAWLVYFMVENTDDALKRIEELGGRVLMPANDSTYGRMAVVSDPNGVVFNIIDESEPGDAQ